MYTLTVTNVCEALPIGMAALRSKGVLEDTRAGPALVMPSPVTTVTLYPTERVLFSAQRDANPAFHLFESIWMLAGRNDVTPLNLFVRDFGMRFGEPDGTMHGAYGHRWRQALGFDQLNAAVKKLKRDPSTRQIVLQMWDATPYHIVEQSGTDSVGDRADGSNIFAGSEDLTGDWKDRPCNTHIYLRIRGLSDPQKRAKLEGMGVREDPAQRNPDGSDYRLMNAVDDLRVLDMTVCCRSNDVIWGAHGANAVHFSVLQEYLAARLGVQIGTLYQISNNYHGYLKEMDRIEGKGAEGLFDNRYTVLKPLPMFLHPDFIDYDIIMFMHCFDKGVPYPIFINPWFNNVLVPVVQSYRAYREKDWNRVVDYTLQIRADDWRAALTEWYQRRLK